MKEITVIFLLFFTMGASAQTDYYSITEDNRLTKAEFDKKLRMMKNSMSKILKVEVLVDTVEYKVVRRKDSIIHFIDLKIAKFINLDRPKLEGEQLPSFELFTLEGEPINLAMLLGKPTLLNFWFVECQPCIDEMPILNEIYEKYKADYNFVAITFEPPEKVEKFLEEHPFKFTHIVEARSFIDQLDFIGYPKNYFLDAMGIIRYVKNKGSSTIGKNGELIMEDGEKIIELLEALKQ